MAYYFSHLFFYDFTRQQRAMIEAIRNAILYGGDQALAASRGEGKSKLAERLLLKYTLSGRVNFSVLFAATGAAARDSLQSIRDEIETNEKLHADYPEACVPVAALENTPNRAHYQTVSGHRHDNGELFSAVPSKFAWCGDEIVFPMVPGSPSAGAIIATRGLDAAVRGLNKRNKRPQVAVIDDPDTEETVRSEDQAHKLEERIDRGIAGLGGQQRSIARVMITTLQRINCVSAWYTDPANKHSWKGKRFRYLIKKPEHMSLWDEYVSLWQQNKQVRDEEGNFTDSHSRGAHAFYLANRERMDEGAEVANVNRFDRTTVPDGSQLEISALQSYFNFVAKNGAGAASAELDNDPPVETGPIESGITAHRIQKQVNGYPRRLVPPDTIKLSQGIDCGKVALHWVVKAWLADGTGHVIDYGVTEVRGTQVGVDSGVDEAIKRALDERRMFLMDNPYETQDGEVFPVARTLVDAGWKTDAIYAWCRNAGLGFWPSMGFGRSRGCIGPRFNSPVRATHDKKLGDQWILAKRPHGVWLVQVNADNWKSWLQDRWMSDPEQPGALLVFGEKPADSVLHRNPRAMSHDQQQHMSFAKHLTAEIEVEEPGKDGVLVRRWKNKSDTNHYLDASVLSSVAASMIGVPLFGRNTVKANKLPPPSQRPSLQQYKEKANKK